MVRAWRGLGIGLLVGALAIMVWAVLDWYRVAYAETPAMVAIVAGSLVLGLAIGWFWPVSAKELSTSIDRRAGLEDRLTTATERTQEHGAFDAELQSDAWARVKNLQPAKVYPIRMSRWHGAGLAVSLVAVSILLLGNTPLLLSEKQKRERAEVKAQGEKVKRVLREEIEEPAKKGELSEAEKRLADELRRLQKEMERGRLTKEEALQKNEELARKADELARKNAQDVKQDLAKAETAMDKVMKQELEKAGLGQVDLDMAKMSDAERKDQMATLQAKIDQLQKQAESLKAAMDSLKQKMQNPGLTQAEKEALAKQMKELQKAADDNRKSLGDAKSEMDALQLSKEAQEVIKKMQEDPIFKEIQELAKKLAKDADSNSQSGPTPKLTKAEREEMLRKLEELAKELKDPEKMKEYLEAIRDAMKNGGKLCRNGKCASLLSLSMGIPGMPGPGGQEDTMTVNNEMVPQTEKPQESKGKTTVTQIVGQRREGVGPESYVEIKAPTMVGNRSSVPYAKVLPQYRKKAESAIEHDKIPKQHQKRVQAYFDSLTGGKK